MRDGRVRAVSARSYHRQDSTLGDCMLRAMRDARQLAPYAWVRGGTGPHSPALCAAHPARKDRLRASGSGRINETEGGGGRLGDGWGSGGHRIQRLAASIEARNSRLQAESYARQWIFLEQAERETQTQPLMVANLVCGFAGARYYSRAEHGNPAAMMITPLASLSLTETRKKQLRRRDRHSPRHVRQRGRSLPREMSCCGSSGLRFFKVYGH